MKDYEGIKLSLENEAKERMNESKFEGRNLFWVKEEKSTEKNEWKKKSKINSCLKYENSSEN